MLNHNKFFISGDFHVNQTRTMFKTTEICSRWNKSVAGSLFELMKPIFSELENLTKKGDSDLIKYGSLNLVPEKFSRWFGTKLDNLEEFILGKNWGKNEDRLLNDCEDGIWNVKWVLNTKGELRSHTILFFLGLGIENIWKLCLKH